MHFFKKCNFPLVLFLFPLLSLSCPPLVPLVTGPFCKRALHLARINPNPESANYSKDGVQLARMYAPRQANPSTILWLMR